MQNSLKIQCEQGTGALKICDIVYLTLHGCIAKKMWQLWKPHKCIKMMWQFNLNVADTGASENNLTIYFEHGTDALQIIWQCIVSMTRTGAFKSNRECILKTSQA